MHHARIDQAQTAEQAGDLGLGALVDVTAMNPSVGWAAGEFISTTADLDTFTAVLTSVESRQLWPTGTVSAVEIMVGSRQPQ